MQDGSGAAIANAESSSRSAYTAFLPEAYTHSRLPQSPPKHLLHEPAGRPFDDTTTTGSQYTGKPLEQASRAKAVRHTVLSSFWCRCPFLTCGPPNLSCPVGLLLSIARSSESKPVSSLSSSHARVQTLHLFRPPDCAAGAHLVACGWVRWRRQ